MKYEVSVKFNRDFLDVDEAGRKITIGVRAKPTKGKANREIIKKLLDLEPYSLTRAVDLSGGNKRKLLCAMSLVGCP